MATVVKSFAIQGIEGYNVDIETKILDGQPMISSIGMGDTEWICISQKTGDYKPGTGRYEKERITL